MNVVRSLLFLLLLIAITLTLLLAGATGVGALLHRLIPAVGLGTGILIALVALSVSVHFVRGMFAEAHVVREELDEAEMEELVAVIRPPARRHRRRR